MLTLWCFSLILTQLFSYRGPSVNFSGMPARLLPFLYVIFDMQMPRYEANEMTTCKIHTSEHSSNTWHTLLYSLLIYSTLNILKHNEVTMALWPLAVSVQAYWIVNCSLYTRYARRTPPPTHIHLMALFTGRMPFLSPNQQRQSTEGKCNIDMQDMFQ